MKSNVRNLALGVICSAGLSVQAASVLFPNGDFGIASGASWLEVPPGGDDFFDFSYPVTGGNSGGYGIIDNSAGGEDVFGIWVSNGGAVITLESLGLTAGETYIFSLDMITLAVGSANAGVKIESWTDVGIGDSGNMRAATSSATWQTYDFPYKIEEGAIGIKVVPLWAPGGSVGFDNIRVNNTPVVPPPFVPDSLPNGNFEIPGGANWGTTQGTPAFPASGGNPGGYAVLDGTDGFAVLYAFDNTEKTFASLGLAAGDTFTLQMDMRVEGGSNIGGIRLEGPAGFVVEQYPTIIDDGAEWATYSIELTVPASPAQAKFGLRPGAESVVAFDNVVILTPDPGQPFSAEIEKGTVVSWNAASELNTYQPQSSAIGGPNDENWNNLGPAFTGNSINSVFQPALEPFYRVLETAPGEFGNGVLNPGFESEEFSNSPADNWNQVAATQGTVTVQEVFEGIQPRSGQLMLALEVDTGVTLTPGNAEVRSDRIAVTGGVSYNLSFFAASQGVAVSKVQQYTLFFFDGFGGVINPPSFIDFETNGTNWTERTDTFTAPSDAVEMTIGFRLVTGAIAGESWVTLVDDVNIPMASGPGNVTVIPAATGPGVEISWPTLPGRSYQVKSSTTLEGFSNFGPAAIGDGTVFSVSDTIAPGKKFYQVIQTP